MKRLLVLVAMLLMIAMPTQARIIVEADNFSDTISYRAYKNVGAYGIREYSFIKQIAKDEHEEYFLRLIINFTNHSSASSRYLLDREADFTVDGKTYKAQKAVNTKLPRSFQRINLFDMCYYSIPKECVNAIAKGKSASFTIYVPNRKPDTISFSEEKFTEIKKIVTNGHFANYLEDINK